MAQRMRGEQRDLACQRAGFVHQGFGGHHAADETPVLRRGRVDHVAGVEQLRRTAHPDHAREDPRPAIAGDDAELEEGHPELGAFRSDADIGKAGDIAAEADGGPVDRRDHGDAQAIQRAQHLVDVVAVAIGDRRSAAAESSGLVAHRLHIAARAERPACAGQDHHAAFQVTVDGVGDCHEFVPVARCAQRVHGLRPVEREDGDGAFLGDSDQRRCRHGEPCINRVGY